MPRRIDIELTSSRDDDTWTWRAAGAKAPKGSVAARLLPEGTKVGDVLKVMQALAQEGRTMVVVTHEMGFAREVSNQLVFLHKGVVEESGNPREVLVNPQSERLQQFLSGSLK